MYSSPLRSRAKDNTRCACGCLLADGRTKIGLDGSVSVCFPSPPSMTAPISSSNSCFNAAPDESILMVIEEGKRLFFLFFFHTLAKYEIRVKCRKNPENPSSLKFFLFHVINASSLRQIRIRKYRAHLSLDDGSDPSFQLL